MTVIILTFSTLVVYSQKIKEIEMEGYLLNSDLDKGISVGLGMKYNYWFSSYIGYTLGGKIDYTSIDLNFASPADEKTTYNLDSQVFNLNAIAGIKIASPTFKNIGIMADLNFMFEPIPYNYVGIDKQIFDSQNNYPTEKSKSKVVYSKFNPSYSFEVSLFYQRNYKKMRGRIALGVGTTNFNPYNTYYQAKIDGIRLKDYAKLKPGHNSFLIFIRLIGST
jgi:hypothetical protein